MTMETISVAFSVLFALVLDHFLGEAKKWHPLAGFGLLASMLEKKLNIQARPQIKRVLGVFSVIALVLPFMFLAFMLILLSTNIYIEILISSMVLYVAIGKHSLVEHGLWVYAAVKSNNLLDARKKTSWLVSRDTHKMSAADINKATVESVLENGNDAIFGAIFWFIVAGIPGVVLYRLSNTLDAMWGYKTARYKYFGWFAARLDDVLNIIPARLTALSYALTGQFITAIQCWHQQARNWESPNAGPVMAAGAGALCIQLGGSAQYQGTLHRRIKLGKGDKPNHGDIQRAVALINRSTILWLVVIFGVSYFA